MKNTASTVKVSTSFRYRDPHQQTYFRTRGWRKDSSSFQERKIHGLHIKYQKSEWLQMSQGIFKILKQIFNIYVYSHSYPESRGESSVVETKLLLLIAIAAPVPYIQHPTGDTRALSHPAYRRSTWNYESENLYKPENCPSPSQEK